MPSPIPLPSPESMTKKTTTVYVIAVVIAAVAIGFFANLLISVRGLTIGSKFEIYSGFILMVLIVAVGLLVHHLFRGLRRAI